MAKARFWKQSRRAAGAAILAGLALGAAPTNSLAGKDPAPSPWGRSVLRATVAGTDLPPQAEARIAVDGAIDEIESATLTLSGSAGLDFGEGVGLGDDIRIAGGYGPSPASVFKGEVVGIEPVFEAEESRLVIRGFNRLHRLTRGRKTRTFEDVTDADVVRTIAGENGLVPSPDAGLTVRYDHVFQHNQTDLEFLRQRASRIGYEVLVDDTALLFRRPVETAPVVLAERPRDGDARLLEFRPRLSSSSSVQKVTVRGWDPVKKEPIAGTAQAPTILLASGPNEPGLLFGASVEVDLGDEPLSSVEDAEAVAWAELALANPVSAEAATVGHPALKAGVVVKVAGAGNRFDGKYTVTAVTHRFSQPSGGEGYRTTMRVRRADGALFRVPEIDDEVLVAFEHGDIDRPVIVGSLWPAR